MSRTLDRRFIERLIYRTPSATRFTQDSPVMPDVWIAFAESEDARLDLILTPHVPVRPAPLAAALRERLGPEASREAGVAYNQASVVARLTLEELLTLVVPMSSWWHGRARDHGTDLAERYRRYLEKDRDHALAERDSPPKPDPFRRLQQPEDADLPEGLRIPLRIVHAILWARRADEAPPEATPGRNEPAYPSAVRLLEDVASFQALLRRMVPSKKVLVYSVNRNRSAEVAILRSVPAIKADAVSRLFAASCGHLTWAVLDSGLDARHPAFRCRDSKLPEGVEWADFVETADWTGHTRVVKTYDFTVVRRLMSSNGQDWKDLPPELAERRKQFPKLFSMLRRQLQEGLDIDWSMLEPFIEVRHDATYAAPYADHGTHVAGILAADWDREEGGRLQGVCPDIKLIDLRVFDRDAEGTEFALMAAMQFLRHRNSQSDIPFVHGANISMSFLHDVSNYACGRTPVCEECQRMVNSGIVVVAAAGNEGHLRYTTSKGPKEGYFSVSITDPGNAESVITVGATHRFSPHTYGVSYFSSRGPTGDGRSKPDLVAPGEKIDSTIASDFTVTATMDGTSMAAPHVSGAAALLIARHSELAGDPVRIKQILCDTATDLGRERYFQGHGMVDVLRAIQSV